MHAPFKQVDPVTIKKIIMENLKKFVKELSERAFREDQEKRKLEVLKVLSTFMIKQQLLVMLAWPLDMRDFLLYGQM